MTDACASEAPQPWADSASQGYEALRRGLVPWLLALSLWVAQPFLQLNFLILTQQLRWYPVEADSIGIPMFGAVMLALIGAPFWLWFCYRNFKHLPRQGSCFAPVSAVWRRHPVRSFVLGILMLLSLWSLTTDVRLYGELVGPYSAYSYFAICEGANSIGWALLWWLLLNCPSRD